MPGTNSDWQPEQMPFLAVGHVARLLVKVNDARLRHVGITVSQLPVLVALKNGERMTQMELARFAGVEQPSMAQLLARMERDGLIRRESALEDRRSSLVFLTDTGAQRLDPGRDGLRAVDRMACKGLDSKERDLLLQLLERIARNLEAAS